MSSTLLMTDSLYVPYTVFERCNLYVWHVMSDTLCMSNTIFMNDKVFVCQIRSLCPIQPLRLILYVPYTLSWTIQSLCLILCPILSVCPIQSLWAIKSLYVRYALYVRYNLYVLYVMSDTLCMSSTISMNYKVFICHKRSLCPIQPLRLILYVRYTLFWTIQSLCLIRYVRYSLCLQYNLYPLSYGVPVRERYGSTLLPATRQQHDQNCTQSH